MPFWPLGPFRERAADLEGGEGGAPGDDVAGDEGGDEGEGEVAEGEAEPVAGVHGLVAEEEVLLEVHGVDGEDDLQGGKKREMMLRPLANVQTLPMTSTNSTLLRWLGCMVTA